MSANKRSQVSPDCKEWDKVFNVLVKMLKNQQQQLQTLFQERKILEDRIKMQHERWVSDVRTYEDHISQLMGKLEEKEMASILLAAKSDLITGFKQREASLHKLKLEQMEDELADFKACFEYFSSNLERDSKGTGNRKRGRHSDVKSAGSKMVEGEVKRLKLEYEKLASEKSYEISALLKEKTFVWNQYNVLENSLTGKLKDKEREVESANKKIESLLANLELLQLSNNEKDEMIARLKNKVVEMELDTDKWKEETSKLSQEVTLLRKNPSVQVTPALKRCNGAANAPTLMVTNRGSNMNNIVVKKESCPVKASVPRRDSEKGSGNLKRKEIDVIDIPSTPRLFSSDFKIPKLKSSATPSR